MYSYTIATLLLVSSVFLDMGAAQTQQVDDSLKNGLETYILLNKQRYTNVTNDMDQTLEDLRKTYSTEIATLDKESALLENRLKQETANLNNLEVISAKSKTCVRNYRDNMPTPNSVERSFAQCKSSIKDSSDLTSAESTKRTLATYYSSNLERALASCKNNYTVDKNIEKYSKCVQNAIDAADKVTIEKQNTFDIQIKKAKCSYESDLKTYEDCKFSVRYNTIEEITKAEVLINNCIDGNDSQKNCPVCNESTTPTEGEICNNVMYLSKNEAENSSLIRNPFRQYTGVECVTVKVR